MTQQAPAYTGAFLSQSIRYFDRMRRVVRKVQPEARFRGRLRGARWIGERALGAIREVDMDRVRTVAFAMDVNGARVEHVLRNAVLWDYEHVVFVLGMFIRHTNDLDFVLPAPAVCENCRIKVVPFEVHHMLLELRYELRPVHIIFIRGKSEPIAVTPDH